MARKRMGRLVAICAAILIVAAACGDDNEEGGSTGQAPTTSQAATATTPATAIKAPQRGGTITIGQGSREPGLDPAKNQGFGSVGVIELMAIYDVLMRYNAETAKYEPRTAESLTANADYSVWTLKLRSNLKFADGNPYDSNAVKYAHDRELAEGAAGPKGQLQSTVAKIEVVDNLTVRYTLIKPWTGFPYILSGANGLIYSPAAHQKAGANFNISPGDAGAGPFKVKSYKPGDAIELERNPTYWGGDVYLDGLKFVFLSGVDATLQAAKASTLQAAFIRDNQSCADAKKSGFGSVEMPGGKQLLLMNAAKGPTANAAVRQAVAHAIDPQVVVDRVYGGVGQPNSAPFSDFPWDPKVEGRKYDPAAARKLIADAKTQGFDGKIRVSAPNTPQGIAWGVAVQAMLQTVGFEVTLDNTKDAQALLAAVIVQGDFDITMSSQGLPSNEFDLNYLNLVSIMGRKSNGYGPQDIMDAIDKLRTATDDVARTAGFKAISEIWNRDVPSVPTTVLMQCVIHSAKLRGVAGTAGASVLFDKAWLDQ